MPKVSPIIHIKQSLMDKGGHRPFTAEFNARGRIQPEPLLAAFAEGGAEDNEICLELSFKEREPNDRAGDPADRRERRLLGALDRHRRRQPPHMSASLAGSGV